MAFSLVATAEPSHTPPRVLLTATESDGAKPIQSCSFFRNGVALRFAATVSGSSAIAYDYDAPFDVSLTYRADAVEADTISSDWTETWASLAAWTVGVAGWSASAGQATSSTSGASISRASSGNVARVTGPAPTFVGSLGYVTISGTAASGTPWSVEFTSEAGITLTTDRATTNIAHSLTSWTLDVGASSVTLAGTGWSLTAPFSGTAATGLKMKSTFIFGTSASIDDITVYKFPDPPTVDVSDSDTATLTGIGSAWLVNSAQPDLALAIEGSCASTPGDYYMTDETRRQTSARSTSVQLDIEGSSRTITVTTGPRKLETWLLEVVCQTEVARRDLLALNANNAVLSLRFPAAMSDLGIDDGFYAVGDITTERGMGPRLSELSTVQMPLTPSMAPSFDALWQWTWDALAQTGMTWDQVAAVFASWDDLLVGPTT